MRAAATDGNRVAQCDLAHRCMESQDCDQAAVWFQRSAEQGDVKAQYNLTVCYLEGRGVDQDLVQAATWCQKVFTNTHQGEDANMKAGLQDLLGSIVHRAAAAGDLACLQQIEKDGMSLKWCDSDGETAMHAAASKGHLEVVRWLHGTGLMLPRR